MSNTKFLLCLSNKALLRSAGVRINLGTLKYVSNIPSKDTPTHTGQEWEKDDYRLARFVDKPKQVNEQYAIDLIAEIPPKACKQRVVSCDGGSGPEGHPRVFINLDKPGNHACGYCGLRFFLDHHH